ncbi:MAG: class I SAM-dependent methyltransferase [Chloroflexi bacterium]|nr:class I SAM-dependent methyltransferase [Chloroflexota bacterium]
MSQLAFSSTWHKRFVQQARWTQDLRRYLYEKAGFAQAQRILEVGCGTGAITTDLHYHTLATVYGLDLNPRHLALAQQNDPLSHFIHGDAASLPFPAGTFDAVLCHFLLLWVADAAQVVREMARLARKGGCVIALAEPDYGGRIDYPLPLVELGRAQGEALKQQGAQPQIGRKLAALFNAAKLKGVESGVLGGQWTEPPTAEAWEMEWQVLEADLESTLPAGRLAELRRIDAAAWQHGERILFVPTFYAYGKVEE